MRTARVLAPLCLMLCVAATAWAQAPTSAGGDTAMGRARSGRIARDARKWTEAKAAFEAALTANDAPQMTEAQRAEILGELGLTEIALEQYRDAAEHLTDSLSRGDALGVGVQRRFEEGRRQAESHVVRLYLGVNPADAEVFLDGHALGRRESSYLLFVEPGRHTVRARLAGYGAASDDFSAGKGEWRRLTLTLPENPPPAPRKAAPPPAAVAPSSAGGTLRIVGFVLSGGAAAVGAGLTIAATVVDDRMQASAAELGPGFCNQHASSDSCKDLQSAVATRDRIHGAGLVTLVGSGVLAGVTISSYWWAPTNERASAPVRVGVTLDPKNAGIVLRSAW